MKVSSVEFKDRYCLISVRGKTGLKRIPLIYSYRPLLEWLNEHPLRDDQEAPLFEKHAARIVDFLLENFIVEDIITPFAFYMAVRTAVIYPQLPEPLHKMVKDLTEVPDSLFSDIFTFVSQLREEEKQELQPTENVVKCFLVMIHLLDPRILKGASIALFRSLIMGSKPS